MVNHHLEQMARAIWTDFQERSMGEALPVSAIALINPDTYSEREHWAIVNYLDTSNITNGQIAGIQRIAVGEEKLPSRARRKVSVNDIVYSTVRPNQRHFGFITNPSEHMLVSTGFTVVRSASAQISNEYIYLMLTSEPIIDKLQQLAEQSVSTYPSIKASDIGALDILVPTTDEAEDIQAQLTPLFRQIAANNEESIRLSELRDALLPRLMSGKLSVADIADAK